MIDEISIFFVAPADDRSFEIAGGHAVEGDDDIVDLYDNVFRIGRVGGGETVAAATTPGGERDAENASRQLSREMSSGVVRDDDVRSHSLLP